MSVYTTILEELGWPNILLLPADQWNQIFKRERDQLGSAWGIASDNKPYISLAKGLRGALRRNVIYHELAHHLFPHRPHWWIECYGAKMSRGGGTGYYSHRFGHSPEDLPSRERLVKLSRRASARFNRRHRL